jgi:hypothetical protein
MLSYISRNIGYIYFRFCFEIELHLESPKFKRNSRPVAVNSQQSQTKIQNFLDQIEVQEFDKSDFIFQKS